MGGIGRPHETRGTAPHRCSCNPGRKTIRAVPRHLAGEAPPPDIPMLSTCRPGSGSGLPERTNSWRDSPADGRSVLDMSNFRRNWQKSGRSRQPLPPLPRPPLSRANRPFSIRSAEKRSLNRPNTARYRTPPYLVQARRPKRPRLDPQRRRFSPRRRPLLGRHDGLRCYHLRTSLPHPTVRLGTVSEPRCPIPRSAPYGVSVKFLPKRAEIAPIPSAPTLSLH